jgi:hypothetical protein
MHKITGMSLLIQIPGKNEFWIDNCQIGETFPATPCGTAIAVRDSPGLDALAIKVIAEAEDIFAEAEGLPGYTIGDASEVVSGVFVKAIQFYTFAR